MCHTYVRLEWQREPQQVFQTNLPFLGLSFPTCAVTELAHGICEPDQLFWSPPQCPTEVTLAEKGHSRGERGRPCSGQRTSLSCPSSRQPPAQTVGPAMAGAEAQWPGGGSAMRSGREPAGATKGHWTHKRPLPAALSPRKQVGGREKGSDARKRGQEGARTERHWTGEWRDGLIPSPAPDVLCDLGEGPSPL